MKTSLFDRVQNQNASSILKLKSFLLEYPDLVKIEKTEEGKEKICFSLQEFKKHLAKDDPKFVVSSFERGLKHQGFCVITTTHQNKSLIKEWMLVEDIKKIKKLNTRKSPRAVQSKKKRLSSEDEYYDEDYDPEMEEVIDVVLETQETQKPETKYQKTRINEQKLQEIEVWAEDYFVRMGLESANDFADLDVVPEKIPFC